MFFGAGIYVSGSCNLRFGELESMFWGAGIYVSGSRTFYQTRRQRPRDGGSASRPAGFHIAAATPFELGLRAGAYTLNNYVQG